MDTDSINDFRRKLAEDCCYTKYRREFHENYEWIEAYSRGNSMTCDAFCKKYGSYFWSLSLMNVWGIQITLTMNKHKKLIKTAAEITKEILDNLKDAEIYVQRH